MAGGQTCPQVPQLLLLLLRLISQPSVCLLPLQSAKPVAQAPLQLPPPHVGVGMLFDEHTIPHPPQLLGLLATLTSHPSICLLPLQSAKPPAQAPLQVPPLHAGAGMLLDEHTVPQPPQLVGLLATLTSHPSICLLPLQSAKPPAQAPLQVPPPHAGVGMWLGEQTLPQRLQLFGSPFKYTSQPSTDCRLQSAYPTLQALRLQVLLTQLDVAFGNVQTRPQAPQLFGLFATLTSQPSACLLPLQSAKPVAQAPLHMPPLHVGVGMLLPEHTTPHPPQLFASADDWTSQPSSSFPLQLLKPDGHGVQTLGDPVHA